MKACKDCNRVVSARTELCPNCKTANFSDEWHGFVAIIDPKRSIIAKKLEIKTPGKYALKVR
ncbi:MAG: transcription elongation factor subunit Spt4 [Euryarchaeota archaeon]|nr:transcription elongation factor subunit Spt4 [Euryarchaeota archaeon]